LINLLLIIINFELVVDTTNVRTMGEVADHINANRMRQYLCYIIQHYLFLTK
jgi:hypothetical protein